MTMVTADEVRRVAQWLEADGVTSTSPVAMRVDANRLEREESERQEISEAAELCVKRFPSDGRWDWLDVARFFLYRYQPYFTSRQEP